MKPRDAALQGWGNWRRLVVWGTAWGIAVTLVEALGLFPAATWGSAALPAWWLFSWLLPMWCLFGGLYLWAADQYPRRWGLLRLITAWLIIAALAATINPLLGALMQRAPEAALRPVLPFALGVEMQGSFLMRWQSTGPYLLWINLFYGGLLVAANVLTVRAQHTRFLLHAAAVSRSRTEVRLDAARLQALATQIEPTLLLDSLHTLEGFYRNDRDHADRLLDALVEFLRCALPGLRSRDSTVEAELRLARAYASLQRERGAGKCWRIDAESLPEASPARFPSLLMLPLLALGRNDAQPVLTACLRNSQVILSLRGLAHSLSWELSQQLRARLRALYGDSFTVETSIGAGSDAGITVSIPTYQGV